MRLHRVAARGDSGDGSYGDDGMTSPVTFLEQ